MNEIYCPDIDAFEEAFKKMVGVLTEMSNNFDKLIQTLEGVQDVLGANGARAIAKLTPMKQQLDSAFETLEEAEAPIMTRLRNAEDIQQMSLM